MIPVSTLLFYCPVDCLADAGWIFSLANTLNLIFGLLAAIALGLQLRRGSEVVCALEKHNDREQNFCGHHGQWPGAR